MELQDGKVRRKSELLYSPCAARFSAHSLVFSCAWAVKQKGWRWIDQVCSGPEFGTTAVSAKWGSSPSLSVFGANREQHRIVEDVVSELNEVLQETPLKKIRLLEPNKSAGIRVYFAPIRKFPDLAKNTIFEYVRGNQGYFYVFWSGGYRINRAYVLLASDKLHGARLKHFALEEINTVVGTHE